MRLATQVDDRGVASVSYMPDPDFDKTVPSELYFKTAVTYELPLAFWRLGRAVHRNEMRSYARTYSIGVFTSPDGLNIDTRDGDAHLQHRFDKPDDPLTVAYAGLAPFILCALEFAAFDPSIDRKILAYVIRHPRMFADGLFEGARAGVMGRAYSVLHDLSL
jgi:hypothetical protein